MNEQLTSAAEDTAFSSRVSSFRRVGDLLIQINAFSEIARKAGSTGVLSVCPSSHPRPSIPRFRTSLRFSLSVLFVARSIILFRPNSLASPWRRLRDLLFPEGATISSRRGFVRWFLVEFRSDAIERFPHLFDSVYSITWSRYGTVRRLRGGLSRGWTTIRVTRPFLLYLEPFSRSLVRSFGSVPRAWHYARICGRKRLGQRSSTVATKTKQEKLRKLAKLTERNCSAPSVRETESLRSRVCTKRPKMEQRSREVVGDARFRFLSEYRRSDFFLRLLRFDSSAYRSLRLAMGRLRTFPSISSKRIRFKHSFFVQL